MTTRRRSPARVVLLGGRRAEQGGKGAVGIDLDRGRRAAQHAGHDRGVGDLKAGPAQAAEVVEAGAHPVGQARPAAGDRLFGGHRVQADVAGEELAIAGSRRRRRGRRRAGLRSRAGRPPPRALEVLGSVDRHDRGGVALDPGHQGGHLVRPAVVCFHPLDYLGGAADSHRDRGARPRRRHVDADDCDCILHVDEPIMGALPCLAGASPITLSLQASHDGSNATKVGDPRCLFDGALVGARRVCGRWPFVATCNKRPATSTRDGAGQAQPARCLVRTRECDRGSAFALRRALALDRPGRLRALCRRAAAATPSRAAAPPASAGSGVGVPSMLR